MKFFKDIKRKWEEVWIPRLQEGKTKIELENRIRFEKEIATMESEMSRLAVLGHIDDNYVDTYFDTIVSHNNLPQFAKKRIEEAKSLVKSRIMFVEGPAGLPMPPEGDA